MSCVYQVCFLRGKRGVITTDMICSSEREDYSFGVLFGYSIIELLQFGWGSALWSDSGRDIYVLRTIGTFLLFWQFIKRNGMHICCIQQYPTTKKR